MCLCNARFLRFLEIIGECIAMVIRSRGNRFMAYFVFGFFSILYQ